MSFDEEPDQILCLDGGEVFSVRTCYSQMLNKWILIFDPGVLRRDWTEVWLKGVPSKMNFFFFGVLTHNHILTCDNLERRVFSLAGRWVFWLL